MGVIKGLAHFARMGNLFRRAMLNRGGYEFSRTIHREVTRIRVSSPKQTRVARAHMQICAREQ